MATLLFGLYLPIGSFSILVLADLPLLVDDSIKPRPEFKSEIAGADFSSDFDMPNEPCWEPSCNLGSPSGFPVEPLLELLELNIRARALLYSSFLSSTLLELFDFVEFEFELLAI
jgi:hypothetical protein